MSSEKTDLQPGKTLTGINSLKMGTPQEIVETLKNRRQTRRVFGTLLIFGKLLLF